jgi:hypothetical protein
MTAHLRGIVKFSGGLLHIYCLRLGLGGGQSRNNMATVVLD